MVSIQTKREDFSSRDPVQDVKYLAERITCEQERARKRREKASKAINPKLIAKLLPADIQDYVYTRKPLRVYLTRKALKGYLEQYWSQPEKTWDELFSLRRYLSMYTLCNTLRGEDIDIVPVTLINAELPELLLDIVKRSNEGEFDKSEKFKHYPLACMALEIFCCLMHRQCAVQPIICERLFRDIPGGPQQLVKVLDGSRSWLESLAVVRFFGAAATNPTTCHWLLRHRRILTTLLRHMHEAPTIVERNMSKVKLDDPTQDNVALCNMLRIHLQKDNVILKTARIVSTLVSGLSALLFFSMTTLFGAHYEEFIVLKGAVYESEILSNFPTIVRQLMRWLSPARFMSGFLEGILRCLEMERARKLLFLDDFAFCRDRKIPPGAECLVYWNHHTLRPSNAAWLVCHALSLRPLFGSNWAAAILTTTLDNAEEEVCRPIIEACGNELFDLAHYIQVALPYPMPVQNILMEALLRHAGLPHKYWDKLDRFLGDPLPAQEMPECCLEAALFCRRANLEEKLSLAEKQYRVKLADTKKDLGNVAFRKGRYKEAAALYTESLAACPLSARSKQAVYYSNRAETYLRMNEPLKAVHDCNRSLCLDETNKVKVQWRRSRAYQKMDYDYCAWLDMYCIEDDWKKSKDPTTAGVEFEQLEASLREKVSIVEEEELLDLERRAIDAI